jgi:hypothetical protein
MAARRAGGDVAGVEDVQIEAQVDQVKVHGWRVPLAGLALSRASFALQGPADFVGASLLAMRP